MVERFSVFFYFDLLGDCCGRFFDSCVSVKDMMSDKIIIQERKSADIRYKHIRLTWTCVHRPAAGSSNVY